MDIAYEELQKIAASSRFERCLTGLRPARRRRKPRDEDKIQLLIMKCRDVADKFPPYRTDDGSLVLPYFFQGDLA